MISYEPLFAVFERAGPCRHCLLFDTASVLVATVTESLPKYGRVGVVLERLRLLEELHDQHLALPLGVVGLVQLGRFTLRRRLCGANMGGFVIMINLFFYKIILKLNSCKKKK